ncbi:MAG: type II toxin-antitoxin system VapC family toxin [Solirubrobacteraceae bacterium]
MADAPPRVYWDTNVLLSYLNGMGDRAPIVEELLRKARAGESEPITSTLTIAELAFAKVEKDGQMLDPEIEQAIDGLWTPGPIKTVEFHALIARDARSLLRRGITQGWGKLKTIDAIHLATAERMGAVGFLTYCHRLQAWDGHLGFPVGEPTLDQTVIDVG